MGPAWLVAALPPGSLAAAARLGWGFRNETWQVDLVDGRRIVVTRFADAANAASLLERTTRLEPRLRAAGIPVPRIVDRRDVAIGDHLATEFIAGRPGAALLDGPSGPEVVGSAMGGAWRRLADVDVAGLPISLGWPSEGGLLAATREGLVDQALARAGMAERARVDEDLATARELLRSRPTSFVHGDFVPVNAVIDDDRLAAVVDLEFAARADPLFDAAWFHWIIDYHHPAAVAVAWGAFVSASRIDDRDATTRELLRVLPVVGLLARLATVTADAEVEHWRGQLRSILSSHARWRP
jgi:aminoglycoside phosphotransferase (APT) family kinase protein